MCDEAKTQKIIYRFIDYNYKLIRLKNLSVFTKYAFNMKCANHLPANVH